MTAEGRQRLEQALDDWQGLPEPVTRDGWEPSEPPPFLDDTADELRPPLRLNTVSTAELLRGTYAQREPLIEGLLVPGATLVHGPAKRGKSWLLMQMATAIGAGEDFLGLRVRRRDVLYVGCEDDHARFKSRLEVMGSAGAVLWLSREALKDFAEGLRAQLDGAPIGADQVVEQLWLLAGRPSVIVLDTQEVFETQLGVTHGRTGDSITRRDYLATSVYDGLAIRLQIAIVLVGHWGEIKSVEKAAHNPHECINTTKARLAGVTTSITLGPLPNQQAGEAALDMQLSIRSRDLPSGDQFLWVRQDQMSRRFTLEGPVRDVLVTQSQQQLFDVLISARKEHGLDHWTTAAELADELDVSTQAIKQMVGRVRRAAKAKGREAMFAGYRLEAKPNRGYRAA